MPTQERPHITQWNKARKLLIAGLLNARSVYEECRAALAN